MCLVQNATCIDHRNEVKKPASEQCHRRSVAMTATPASCRNLGHILTLVASARTPSGHWLRELESGHSDRRRLGGRGSCRAFHLAQWLSGSFALPSRGGDDCERRLSSGRRAENKAAVMRLKRAAISGAGTRRVHSRGSFASRQGNAGVLRPGSPARPRAAAAAEG
jgi:hypothetical protein